MHTVKNFYLTAAVLAVSIQYPQAVEVKMPSAHSQVTPHTATV